MDVHISENVENTQGTFSNKNEKQIPKYPTPGPHGARAVGYWVG